MQHHKCSFSNCDHWQLSDTTLLSSVGTRGSSTCIGHPITDEERLANFAQSCYRLRWVWQILETPPEVWSHGLMDFNSSFFPAKKQIFFLSLVWSQWTSSFGIYTLPPSSSIGYPSFVVFIDTVILWIIHPNLIASPLTSLEISPPLYMTFLEHWHFPPAYAHDYFFKIQFIFLHPRIFLNEMSLLWLAA